MSNEENCEDLGIVTALNANKVQVEVVRGSGCKSCTLHGFCFSKNTPAVFHLETELHLQVGDQVRLDIAPKNRILSSFFIFLMPILFLFAGYGIASIFLTELYAALLGFAALASSFLLLRLIDKKLGKKLMVNILEKVQKENE